jgi:hypothetical protein
MIKDAYMMALFGEAERGEYHTPYYCETLPQLVEFLGNPPPDSLGLYFAVQALLFSRKILFFRVKEEGYSLQDYFLGMRLLEKRDVIPHLEAIGIPGVGSSEIIEAMIPLCACYHSILVLTEMDLYDYVMQTRES